MLSERGKLQCRTTGAPPAGTAATAAAVPAGWKSATSADGRIYYYARGEKTRWSRPTMAAASAEASPPPPPMRAGLREDDDFFAADAQSETAVKDTPGRARLRGGLPARAAAEGTPSAAAPATGTSSANSLTTSTDEPSDFDA